MSRLQRSRRALAATLLGVAVFSGTAVASDGRPERLVQRDIRGDANAVNDQGEGLIGNIATEGQVAQADLREVRLEALTNTAGAASGWRLAVTTTARPAPLADGTPLSYGVVMQPDRDCRLVVEYVSRGISRTGRSIPHAGRLIHSCDGGHYTQLPLRAALNGRTATVDVPYTVLPAQAQAGAEAHPRAAYVRTAPFGELNRAKPGQIDRVRTTAPFFFPR